MNRTESNIHSQREARNVDSSAATVDASVRNNYAVGEAGEERLYLLLSSRGTLYAIEVSDVREIHALPSLNVLPQAPHAVAGVVNVRGDILPVVDLARQMGQTPRAPALNDGLVVLQNTQDRSPQQFRPFALWVEEVRDMIALQTSQIEVAPFDNEYSMLSGLTHHNGAVVFILQTSRLLPHVEIAAPFDTSSFDAFDKIEASAAFIFRRRAQNLAQVERTESQTVPRTGEETRNRAESALLANVSAQISAHESTRTVSIARVRLGGEEHGVVLSQVREFCALESFTAVPCCPPHIAGQMNLRGDIVTLLDIAPQMGIRSFAARLAQHNSMHDEADATGNSAASTHLFGQIVVVETRDANGAVGLIGVLVDEVFDVLHARENDLRAVDTASDNATRNNSGFCQAILLHDEKALTILDLASIVADDKWIVNETV